MTDIDREVAEMKWMADHLSAFPPDPDLAALGAGEVVCGGYHVQLHFAKERHGEAVVYILRAYGRHVPFLPFDIVCLVGRKFLGDSGLVLTEAIVDGHKIYIWSAATDLAGRPVAIAARPHAVEPSAYDGFAFHRVTPAANQ